MIHHTPANVPFQPEGLPEARLPEHIVHSGGGSWLAYKKHTSWAPLVSPLTLLHTCHSAKICSVELTLDNCTKATIISCYLSQTVEAHSLTCAALTQLPHTLPHSLIILGEYLQGGWVQLSPKDALSLASHTRCGRGPCVPPLLHANNQAMSHALTISPYGTLGVSPAKLRTPSRSKQPS